MEKPEHRTSVALLRPMWSPQATLITDRNWIASCSACRWRYQTNISRALAEDHAHAHQVAVGALPAPAVVVHADHEQDGETVRLGFSPDRRVRCRCGSGWTGPLDLVERALADHLAKYAADPDRVLPAQPPPPQAPAPPRRLR